MKVQLFVVLAVLVMIVGCKTSQPADSGLPSIPSPKSDQFIFCAETEAEGRITVTINAPEYIESVSQDFFVRRQRVIGELALIEHSAIRWKGENRFPRDGTGVAYIHPMTETLRCCLSLKIMNDKISGTLDVAANFCKTRYKVTEPILFPLRSGGSGKFGIVELKVSELRLTNISK